MSNHVNFSYVSGSCIRAIQLIALFTAISFYSPLVRSTSLSCDALELQGWWTNIKGNTHLKTKNFCVMQFEARAGADFNRDGEVSLDEIKSNGCDGEGFSCAGGSVNWASSKYIPISIPEHKPWRNVTKDRAIDACRQLNNLYPGLRDLGMEFDLISNKEWQTIAWAIENGAINWSDKRVGKGCIFQGNNGGAGLCGYDGEDPESGGRKEAMHILPEEQLIYHFSANLSEWVKYDTEAKKGEDKWMFAHSSKDYGPQRTYPCDNKGCGMGFAYWFDDSPQWVFRGGDWYMNDLAGIFSLAAGSLPSYSSMNLGFRCVLRLTGTNE